MNCNGYFLDYVLTDAAECLVSESSDPLLPADRHHPCLVISLPVFSRPKSRASSSTSDHDYNFRKANNVAVYHSLNNVNWSSIDDMNNVDEAVDFFYTKLYKVLDLHVPKTKKSSRNYPKWYTPEIIRNIRKKERLRRKFQRTKLATDSQNFSAMRSQLKREMKIAYKQHLLAVEAEIGVDPNQFWKFVKDQRKHDNSNSVLFFKDKPLLTNEDKCNAFAEYFHSVYSEEEPDIDVFEILNSTPVGDRILNMLNLQSITESDLLNAFKKLKSKKCKGDDGIPQFILIAFKEILVRPLLSIFNLSLKTCTFPAKWKNAIVIPIPKKPQTKLVSEFRPISLLCCFSKLFELVLHEKLFNHLKLYIHPQQYGFMPNRSTTTNLANFTYQIYEAFSKKEQCTVIYTDFAKAFDSVCFDVVLRKLTHFGLSPQLVRFFCSYLVGRTQTVLLNGTQSNSFTLNSSVPQGSNLGPLLFNVVINDLIEVIKYCIVFLFADDLKLCLSVKNITDCEKIQADINALIRWCIKNKLKLNVGKCFFMNFTLKKNVIEYCFTIGNENLPQKSECKDLGIILDTKLTYESHIRGTVNSALRMLGFIKRVCRNFSSLKTAFLLFNAFVRSRLEFGSLVWNPLHDYKVNLLERPQRRFLRYLALKSNLPDSERMPYSSLLLIFNCQSLEKRREATDLIYLYKVVNNLEDNQMLREKCFLRVGRGTRLRDVFYCENARLNCVAGSPLHRMCAVANKFSNEIDLFCSTIAAIKNTMLR